MSVLIPHLIPHLTRQLIRHLTCHLIRQFFLSSEIYLKILNIKVYMDEILFKTFPVQTKMNSGFFKMSSNTFLYSLTLTNSKLSLKFFGIPIIRIATTDILGFKYVGDKWVVTQKVFNGVVIKYKKSDKVKERVISFFNKEKSSEFLKTLRKIVGNKENK